MSEIWSKMYIGLHVRYRLLLQILIRLELSRQIFEKKPLKNQISRNPLHWRPNCSMGRTDRQDENNSRFS